MYTIIRALDGTFKCQFRLQDGTEFYTEPTVEKAIEHAKTFAKVMNGAKIKKKDITFLQEKKVTETELVPWIP